MADDDEDVIFSNSALYQYMQEAGLDNTEAEIVNIVKPGLEVNNSSSLGDGCGKDEQDTQERAKFQFLSSAREGVLGLSMQNDAANILQKSWCNSVYQSALTGRCLDEDDVVFLENVLDAETTVKHNVCKLILKKTSSYLAILAGCSAYITYRFLYDTGHYNTLWASLLTDILVGLAATYSIFTPSWHLVKVYQFRQKLRQSLDAFSQLNEKLVAFMGLCKKITRFIQEAELVARGFTLISSQTPVCRMERSSLFAQQRQCPDLRRTAYHVTTNLMLRCKDVTVDVARRLRVDESIDRVASPLAYTPLDQYGPCVTLLVEADHDQLEEVTDHYSLSALKSVVSLCNLHLSELVKRIVLGCCTIDDTTQRQESCSKMATLLETCSGLNKDITVFHNKLEKCFKAHRCQTVTRKEAVNKSATSSQSSALLVAVHSLQLHLQSSMTRVQGLEDKLEQLNEKQEEDLGDEERQELMRGLEVVKSELAASEDCWQEALSQLDGKQSCTKIQVPEEETKYNQLQNASQAVNPVIVGEKEPVHVDQVFLAYTDASEQQTESTDFDLTISEELEKRKREKREARRLLSELRTVISVKAVEHKERERIALQRMGHEAEEESPPAEKDAVPTEQALPEKKNAVEKQQKSGESPENKDKISSPSSTNEDNLHTENAADSIQAELNAARSETKCNNEQTLLQTHITIQDLPKELEKRSWKELMRMQSSSDEEDEEELEISDLEFESEKSRKAKEAEDFKQRLHMNLLTNFELTADTAIMAAQLGGSRVGQSETFGDADDSDDESSDQ